MEKSSSAAKVKRTTRLLQRDPQQMDAIMSNPHQRWSAQVIADLLTQLRDVISWKGYYEFQRLLFSYVIQAEQDLAEATRQAKRLQRGKPPSSSSKDWVTEQAVLDRVVRQLRTVGDAMAWRLFGFDRRLIMAASANEHAGTMVGKAGLEYELGEIQALWENEKTFALLHGLTNVLRVADITRFESDGGVLLVEVKKGKAPVPRRQLERMQRAVDVVMKGAPLPGLRDEEYGLYKCRQQIRSRLRELEKAFEAAAAVGASCARLGDQWVVTCVSAQPEIDEEQFGSVIADSIRRKQKAFDQARMGQATHHLRSPVIDRANLQLSLAPPTIFPLKPTTCALLTCDYFSYESVISWERLAGRFKDRGYEVTCPLPNHHEVEVSAESPILHVSKSSRKLTLHAGGISQIHTELVPPEDFAEAAIEMLESGSREGRSVFTFSNERAVWK